MTESSRSAAEACRLGARRARSWRRWGPAPGGARRRRIGPRAWTRRQRSWCALAGNLPQRAPTAIKRRRTRMRRRRRAPPRASRRSERAGAVRAGGELGELTRSARAAQPFGRHGTENALPHARVFFARMAAGSLLQRVASPPARRRRATRGLGVAGGASPCALVSPRRAARAPREAEGRRPRPPAPRRRPRCRHAAAPPRATSPSVSAQRAARRAASWRATVARLTSSPGAGARPATPRRTRACASTTVMLRGSRAPDYVDRPMPPPCAAGARPPSSRAPANAPTATPTHPPWLIAPRAHPCPPAAHPPAESEAARAGALALDGALGSALPRRRTAARPPARLSSTRAARRRSRVDRDIGDQIGGIPPRARLRRCRLMAPAGGRAAARRARARIARTVQRDHAVDRWSTLSLRAVQSKLEGAAAARRSPPSRAAWPAPRAPRGRRARDGVRQRSPPRSRTKHRLLRPPPPATRRPRARSRAAARRRACARGGAAPIALPAPLRSSARRRRRRPSFAGGPANSAPPQLQLDRSPSPAHRFSHPRRCLPIRKVQASSPGSSRRSRSPLLDGLGLNLGGALPSQPRAASSRSPGGADGRGRPPRRRPRGWGSSRASAARSRR